MARRYYRKLGILAKVETLYGTDSVPTGAANAMLMNEVTVTPLQGEVVRRDLLLPYFGDTGSVLAATYARLEGSVELAGAGAAGTAPAYGPLLRACSMSQTLTAGTKVEYEPISSEPEAASIYCNLDGVNHVMIGARGSWTLNITPRQIPRIRFTLSGLLGPIADVPLPTVDHTDFVKPIVVSKANTTFSLHGLNNTVMESLQLDLGNQVEPRMLVGEETIEVTNRMMTGTVVLPAQALAVKDWYAIARASTLGAMLAKHGTVAGNIVEIESPAVQIGQPTYGNTQGVLNNSLPLMFVAAAGDDEAILRVR